MLINLQVASLFYKTKRSHVQYTCNINVFTAKTVWKKLSHLYLILQNTNKYIFVKVVHYAFLSTPMTERSKAKICDRSLAGIEGTNLAGVIVVCLSWLFCFVR